MTAVILLLGALVLFMLAGVLPARGNMQTAVFVSPVFISLLLSLGVSLVITCVRRRFSAKWAGFALSHLGVAVILGGALLGFLVGQKGNLVVPTTTEHAVSELPISRDASVSFGFGVSAVDFEATFHDPPYDLYREDADAEGGYAHVGRFRVQDDGSLDLGEAGSVTAAALKESNGLWRRHVSVPGPGGLILQRGPMSAQDYRATLAFTTGGKTAKTFPLAVNHPVTFHGWRFYLMDYDQDGEPPRYVVLTARQDPGRRLVIFGIYMTIVGVALLGFRRGGGARAVD